MSFCVTGPQIWLQEIEPKAPFLFINFLSSHFLFKNSNFHKGFFLVKWHVEKPLRFTKTFSFYSAV